MLPPIDRTLIEAFRAGRHLEAVMRFEALEPARQRHPVLLEVAANLYGQLGRPDDEIAQWQLLCALQPNDGRVCRSLASALLERDRLDEAGQVLQHFAQRHPENAEVGGLLAQVWLRLRRPADAVIVLTSLRANATGDAWAALTALEARARYHLDDRSRARDLLAAIDANPPTDAAACREVAQAWRELHAPDRAVHWYERAVQEDPSCMETWAALASCHEQNRDATRARTLAEALRGRVGPSPRLDRLLVRLDHHDGRLDAALTRADQLFEADLPLPDRRSLHLEVARIAQRTGDRARTIHHAHAGNALARQEFVRQGLVPGEFTAHVRHVRDRVHADLRPAPARTTGPRAPVIVAGFPRSGTTLVQQMLQAHPRIESLDETDPGTRVLRRYWRSRPELTPAPFPEQLDQIPTEAWPALRDAYFVAVAEDGVPRRALEAGTVLVDKLPLSLVRLHWLARLFPDATLVVCLRDPRDVVWSNYVQDYAPNPFSIESTSLRGIAELVAATLEGWLAWRADPPLHTVELSYEATTRDPETAMRSVLEAIELPFDEAVLDSHRGSQHRVIRTPSYHDVSQPIHTKAQGRWRDFADELAPVLPVLEPVIEAFGHWEPR